MENATKALLIGAGMLFAVVVVSMALYAYLQITEYYTAKQDAETTAQMAEFNNEYEAYARDDVTGFELVSLINKIINYNAQNSVDSNLGFSNTDKQWEKMYIEFTITDQNITQGIENSQKQTIKLFTNSTYNSEHSKTETELKGIINDMNKLENKYSAGVLSKLVSNRDSLEIYGGSGKTIKEVLGKDVTELPTEDEVIKYEQYIEFKRAEFECTDTEYNETTARIVKLVFKQK